MHSAKNTPATFQSWSKYLCTVHEGTIKSDDKSYHKVHFTPARYFQNGSSLWRNIFPTTAININYPEWGEPRYPLQYITFPDKITPK